MVKHWLRHRRGVLFWALAIAGIAAPWLLPFAEKGTCIVLDVHDGDTTKLSCGGETLKVRLYCIDAPEIAQKPWGEESRDHLRSLAGSTVTLRHVDKDRYGRTVGELYRDGASLNLAMVAAGRAAVYGRYCGDWRFEEAERQAKAAGRGIWSRPGQHQTPWAFRKITDAERR